ncbi:hypothetical protein B7435_23920 [Mycolicibacterium peregrinum]|nr:hypothetical protein [Mycolicibacterium peregrinum]OBG15012.1 hypothetical protein A5768_08240 [Mycolicibacterium fortuitum]OWL98807.1 hypothetical protein B7435_23920 [Mycolicibacterium peregrinum]
MVANIEVPQTTDAAHASSWSDFSRPVWDFAQVLRAADLMPSDEDEYWGKPHKWDPEHQLWDAAGCPCEPDGGEPMSLGWRRFLDAVTQREASQ